MLIKYNEFHSSPYEINDWDVVGMPSGEIIVMNQQQVSFFKARNIVKYKDKVEVNGEWIVFENYVYDDDNKVRIIDWMESITWNNR